MEDTNAQAQKVGADRSALMENYHKAAGLPVIEKEVSETAPVEALAGSDNASDLSGSDAHPVGDKSEETPAAVSVEPGEKTHDAQNKPVEKKDEKEILVSKKALDEEREKRKSKTLEARQAIAERDAERQSRLQLEARVKELESKLMAPAKPGAPIAKEDEVTRQLAEENRRLKEENQKASAKAKAEADANEQAKMQKLVADTGAKLDAEGFPGFTRFTVDVANVLSAKVDAGELDVNEITPELWAKTYREEVYPNTKKIFDAKVKQEKDDKRKSDKRSASLVRTPGAPPHMPEEKDADQPQTAEGYMKFRKVLK